MESGETIKVFVIVNIGVYDYKKICINVEDFVNSLKSK